MRPCLVRLASQFLVHIVVNRDCIRPANIKFRHWSTNELASSAHDSNQHLPVDHQERPDESTAPAIIAGPNQTLAGVIRSSQQLADGIVQLHYLEPLSQSPPIERVCGSTNLASVSGNSTETAVTCSTDPIKAVTRDQAQILREVEDQETDPPALVGVQEVCLIRYFTEELAHWYTKSTGVEYYGQYLPHLTAWTSVEYMLKCIPALSAYHDLQHSACREDIMAAAVVLRQCEEMDEESSETMSEASYPTSPHPSRSVNFLSIAQSIIENAALLRDWSPFTSAIFWMAVRQDIYHCMVKKQAPLLSIDPDMRKEASIPNKLILHAGDVANWCWGTKSAEEWREFTPKMGGANYMACKLIFATEKLMADHRSLVRDNPRHFSPIFTREADQLRGEIFPTVWYNTDAEATSIQFFEASQVILIAETPQIE
ncbi:hypothetical protein N0V90_004478 [Kalmusia sp. IMI 367209]|nr:hypothetical protein N0V90_004478 [Kalmusia sp. IMI 367209]